MEINMLEAISEMIKDTKETEVKCAKIMLDKVILGMKEKCKSKLVVEDVRICTVCRGYDSHATDCPKIARELEPVSIPHKESLKARPPAEPDPNGYEMVVDTQNRILKIKNLPLEALVSLDGVTMTHQEAIGKTFTEGKIL